MNSYKRLPRAKAVKATGVCEQNIPPERDILRKTGFQSTKSWAGEQFLLQDYTAKAGMKGECLFADTGMIIEI